jgi:hypothetical protein
VIQTWRGSSNSRSAAILLPEVTLVGGCAAGLLITDPGAASVRATFDVDIVVEAATYVKYQAFCARLETLGFSPCSDPGAPMCRWTHGALGVDVMSLYARALGFSNPWYASALRTRTGTRLPSGALLHHIDAPHFVATKLQAFLGRGGNDYVLSHDLEDIVRVMDGRPGIGEELGRSPWELGVFVARELSRCLADRFFLEAMPGYFPGAEEGAARARLLERRIRAIVRELPATTD